MPKAAQRVFRAAFNSALEQYGDEERAFATAWAAVRRAGYERGEDGRWHRVEKRFEIAKINEDERLVFGWASVAVDVDGKLVVDRQDDVIPPEELEKAAYRAMEARFEAGEMHVRKGIGNIVESVVFTPQKLEAMGLEKDALPVGWWIGVRVTDDEVWKAVKKGEYRAFSIHGKAIREEVSEDAEGATIDRD